MGNKGLLHDLMGAMENGCDDSQPLIDRLSAVIEEAGKLEEKRGYSIICPREHVYPREQFCEEMTTLLCEITRKEE